MLLHQAILVLCAGLQQEVLREGDTNNIFNDLFFEGIRALIWYWDHLKNFIKEIPQGPLVMFIGTIWVTQKRFQGPPARGF